MRIVSFTNHKGGVAKTTSVASLGVSFANLGKRVLLVDLDPQCNLSDTIPHNRTDKTILNTLRGEDLYPIKVKDNLDLCPGSVDLVSVDSGLETLDGGSTTLSRILNRTKYDYIFIDCPPSLARLTQTALSASTDVIIPITPEALPSKGVNTILKVIGMTQEGNNPRLRLSGFILTRVRRRKVDRLVEDLLRSTFGDLVFKTRIRENVDLSESPLKGEDIYTYAPESNGAKDYQELAKEILGKLE